MVLLTATETASYLEPTVIFSVILAIIAMISPMITTYLNNKHELKIKEMEITNHNINKRKEELTEVYSTYLKKLSDQISSIKYEAPIYKDDLTEYKSSYLVASLYAASSFTVQSALYSIDQNIKTKDWKEADIASDTLSRVFAAHIDGNN